MNTLRQLYDTQVYRMAEQDLGGQLQSANATVMSHDEIALRVCMTAPEYTAGPFTGFRRVVAVDKQDKDDKQRFLHTIQCIDGRVLLMPTPDMSIVRTLVKVIDAETVMLTCFQDKAKITITPAQKTILSAVNGFNDSAIGTHTNGIKTEPGHVTLTSAVILGAYSPINDIHQSIHAFEDKTGTNGNILTASTTNTDLLGVALPSRQYTYEEWPQGLQLLWHPDERVVHAASEEDAVARVQAAGFVALREKGLVGVAVDTLGSMK